MINVAFLLSRNAPGHTTEPTFIIYLAPNFCRLGLGKEEAIDTIGTNTQKTSKIRVFFLVTNFQEQVVIMFPFPVSESGEDV